LAVVHPTARNGTDDARLLQEWILNCQGFGMTFEIVPVVPNKETCEVVAPYLDQS